MAESWYLQDKGKSLFGGTESEFSAGLDTVFRELVSMADNGYTVRIDRVPPPGTIFPLITEDVIIQSSTQSKHGEKTILFNKGTIRIGDIINYESNRYLISSWVNEDITMNDSAPMHLCNANILYDVVTKTASGSVDELGRPIYNTVTVETSISAVFDTMKFYSDSDSIINLESDTIECWIQYSDDLMDGQNIQVRVYGKRYTVEGVSRDMLVLEDDNYYGVLKLKLRIKE